ncbi:MAG: NAD(P)H-hydrate epimerase, partial [Bacteroidales bacterium]|nr:NAD(P)H-hydrate epimerase [Bacteroidales bacterium]
MCALKILPVEKIREADAFTIAHEPIRSVDLMERAAEACFRWVSKKVKQDRQIRIICGMGNNGGDGLALARMLCNQGYETDVQIIRHTATPSADFSANFELLGDLPGIVITDVFESDPEIDVGEDDIVIDALLGSGLNKPVTGFIASVIGQINNSNALVIAIDIPSGLFADVAADHKKQVIVKADYTLTFQMPKLAFLMAENEIYTGRWKVL